MEITRLLATRQLPDLMIKSSAADLPVKPEIESALEGRETSHSPVKLTVITSKGYHIYRSTSFDYTHNVTVIACG
jgi:hypothetical protein